jgi:hypothetical protein
VGGVCSLKGWPWFLFKGEVVHGRARDQLTTHTTSFHHYQQNWRRLFCIHCCYASKHILAALTLLLLPKHHREHHQQDCPCQQGLVHQCPLVWCYCSLLQWCIMAEGVECTQLIEVRRSER